MCRYGAGGTASRALEQLGVAALSGSYEAGLLQGRGRLHMLDGSIREGWFHNGRLHGPVRGITKVSHFFKGTVSGKICKSLRSYS